MAKRVKDPFPPEHEAECLALLERFGHFADVAGVAKYFGVSTKSLAGFLRSRKAKSVSNTVSPEEREALKASIRAYDPPAAWEPALPEDEKDLAQLGIRVEEPYSGGPILSKRSELKTK